MSSSEEKKLPILAEKNINWQNQSRKNEPFKISTAGSEQISK